MLQAWLLCVPYLLCNAKPYYAINKHDINYCNNAINNMGHCAENEPNNGINQSIYIFSHYIIVKKHLAYSVSVLSGNLY